MDYIDELSFFFAPSEHGLPLKSQSSCIINRMTAAFSLFPWDGMVYYSRIVSSASQVRAPVDDIQDRSDGFHVILSTSTVDRTSLLVS